MMKFNNKSARIIIPIIVAIIVAGFFIVIIVQRGLLRSQIGDGGFLTGVPCGAPCFWDIKLNQTTDDEVWAILQAKGISKQCTTNIAESGEKGIVCKFPGEGPDGYLGSVGFGFQGKGATVNSIDFWPGATITLQDAIAKYGHPDQIIIWDCCNVEQPQSNLALFYTRPYMELELAPQDYMQCDIEPTNTIVGIVYLNAEKYKEKIKIFNESPWRKSYGNQWKGYGKCE